MNRLVLLVCCLGAMFCHASTPFPGGVLDESGRTAFVPVEEGIEAVDLETGLSRWRNSQATWPLFVSGDQLYTVSLRRGSMSVMALGLTEKGAKSYESDSIELPTWVDANNLRLAWTLHKRTLTSAWQARGSLGRQHQGCVSINLAETKVTPTKEGCPLVVEVVAPALLQREAVRWHRSIAGHLHAVVEEDGPMSSLLRRKKTLVLRVWNEASGKETRAVEMISGTRPMLLPGLDGRQVWVREGGTFEAPGDASPWQVHSALDGHVVARVTFVPGTSQGSVIGNRAYGIVTRTGRVLLEGISGRRHELYAVDIESGKILWRRPVKENGTVAR